MEKNNTLISLAAEWLSFNRKGDIAGIEIMPFKTTWGMIVYFYYEETWEDLPYFLTVPMVEELLAGKNPKKVKNNYLKRNDSTTSNDD